MKYFSSGKIIKEFRERRGISQLELCEGLCEPPTLCKIETGRQNPNKKLLEAISARLQIPVSLDVPITRLEFERAQIEREIMSRISRENYLIEEFVKKYKDLGKDMNKFEKQFYHFAHAVHLEQNENNFQKALDEFSESLSLTFPSYCHETDISKHLFIPLELILLNSIATCLYCVGKKTESISLLGQIIRCLEHEGLEREEYAKLYPAVTFNLSTYLGIIKNYEESLKITEQGLACCLKYERFGSHSRLLYNKGYTLFTTGRKDEGLYFLKQSFFSMQILEQNRFFNNAKEDIINSFGIEVWKEIENAIDMK